MRRAFGYVRQVFGQGAEGVQAQRQSIFDYFESRLKPEGFTWGGFYEDGAASGSRELRSRSAGLKLDLKLEAGDAAVFATSAAFRSTRELIQVINRWTERSVTTHVLDVKLDFSTDMGKGTLRMLEFGADTKRFIYSEQEFPSAYVMMHDAKDPPNTMRPAVLGAKGTTVFSGNASTRNRNYPDK
jgi:DNA invertase Pin-like site-specific DNA recombinase